MQIDPLIEEIRQDTDSETRVLLEKAARAIVAFAGSFRAPDSGEFRRGLVEAGRKLFAARPDLPPLFHLVTELYALAGDAGDVDLARRAVRAAAVEFTQSLAAREEKVGRQGARILPDGATVLTAGRSPLVEGILAAAAAEGRLGGVVVSEGRPRLDGRLLAANLLAAGAREVTLVTDAALPGFLPEADRVLLGATAVYADHVLARPGTSALALAARAEGKPVQVAAGVLELLPATPLLPEPGLAGDPARVWEAPPEGLAVVNLLYEKVPLSAFGGILIESGLVSPWDMERRIRSMGVPPWLGD